MKQIHLAWLVPIFAASALACSSSSDSGAASDSTTPTHDDGGADSGKKTDAGAGEDAGSRLDAASTADANVASLPAFAFTIGGNARTLKSMRIYFSSGDPDCTNEIAMEAQLVPAGDEIDDPGDPPELQLTLCVDDLPASGDEGYGITTEDESVAQLQFQFLTSGTSHFPIADGPGVHVIKDGSAGVFEMSASGTFDLSDGAGGTAFTLQLNQPIAAK